MPIIACIEDPDVIKKFITDTCGLRRAGARTAAAIAFNLEPRTAFAIGRLLRNS